MKDGTTLKQRKMAKVQAANADKALAMAEVEASDDTYTKAEIDAQQDAQDAKIDS